MSSTTAGQNAGETRAPRRTYDSASPISGAKVRLVDRQKLDADAVSASGEVATAGRDKHVKRIVRRGAVVTVSTRTGGTQRNPTTFAPISAMSFGKGDCRRQAKRITCRTRGKATFRARILKHGRLAFTADVAGLQLRQPAKTRFPLRLELATTHRFWRAAPSKCASDVAERVKTTDCRGRTTASVLRSPVARGPVSLKWISRLFTNTKKSRKAALAASGNGCGSVMTETSKGLNLASGFVSLVPAAGPILRPVVKAAASSANYMGAGAGFACVQAQFKLINQQLANEESQIADLQTDLQLSENQFYQGELSDSVATTEVSAQLYANALEALSPTTAGGPGLFGQFMEQTGLWTLGMQPVAGSSIQESATTASTFQSAMSMATNASYFTQNLNDMSGSQIPVTKCAEGGCANVVQASPTSALLGMWNSKAQTLLKAWQAAQDAGGPSGSNVVGLYDEYNNSIIADYIQSLSTLQQAFQMEYMANQMNLYHAQQSCQGAPDCEQIQSFGTVPGTWYSFNTLGASASQNSQIKAYNNVQQQLTATYASRVNTLYVDTLNYIATDVPVGSQAYPTVPGSHLIKNKIVTSPNPINYAKQMGVALPGVLYGPARTPLLQLPSATAGAWTSQAALYQFGGLQDVNTCAKAVAEYNQAYGTSRPQVDLFSPSNCPAIFVLSNGDPLDQGYYDGDRIQPYTSYTPPTPPVTYKVQLSTGPTCTVTTLTYCEFGDQPLTLPTATVTASNGSTPTGVQVTGYQTSAKAQTVLVEWKSGPAPPAPTPPGTTTPLTLSGVMQVNLRLCNATDPELTWYVPGAQQSGNAAGLVQGQIYLSCGNWGQVVTNQCFPGAHCPTAWSQLAPAPSSYVTSQYYQTATSYPNTTQGYETQQLYSNNEISYNGSNWAAAIQFMGTPGQSFTSSKVAYQSSSGTWYFGKVTSDQSTWEYAVAGLPTGNAANTTGMGFNIPVQMAYWNNGGSDYYGSLIPRQDAQMAVDGFVCSGNSCTVADGGTFSFSMTHGSGSWVAEGWASLSVN